MASCGEMPARDSLAATPLLRQHLPSIKVKFVKMGDRSLGP
jgi:phosphoketolase